MTTDLNGGVDSQELPLSVVIVTYNEEERIQQCIESVFDACRGVVGFEVILVDSNSTDRTRAYATEYPITVLRISDDELTTPGAGRYVGAKAARGEHILFVDGDMVLEQNWLSRAIDCLESGEEVVAVDGHLNDVPADGRVRSVDAVWGVALYHADALRSVGGFHPFLKSLEDIYLGYRLAEEGSRLVRLPVVTAHHPESEAFFEVFRRWREGYMLGPGQVLRMSALTPGVFRRFLRLFKYHFIVTGWLLVGLATALTSLPLLLGWFVLSLVGFAVVATLRGVVGAVDFVVQKTIATVGLVRGLFVRTDPPETFPMDCVEQVQWGPVHFEPVRELGVSS